MPNESWQYDPRWGTAIDLSGCQFGFQTDDRCNIMLCKFRTTRDRAPEEPRESCRALCIREMEIADRPADLSVLKTR
jgi:hypothetical protein